MKTPMLREALVERENALFQPFKSNHPNTAFGIELLEKSNGSKRYYDATFLATLT